MTKAKIFLRPAKSVFLLSAAIMALNTGCAVRVNEPAGAAVDVGPTVVVQDDYVYYPGYDIYYNSYRHQYAYLEGGAWVSRPQPRGVSVNVLLASPSVKMDFHDSPALHHAAVVQKYPKNWTPARKDGPGNGRPGEKSGR